MKKDKKIILFSVLMDKKGEIIRKYTDGKIKPKLHVRCDQIVRKELPEK